MTAHFLNCAKLLEERGEVGSDTTMSVGITIPCPEKAPMKLPPERVRFGAEAGACFEHRRSPE